MNYDETTVVQGLDLLRQKQLVLKVSGAGHRVEKYAHRLGETLNLGRRELAILCVLMLRGPQTVGELRGRTERMHPFAELEEVEHVLEVAGGAGTGSAGRSRHARPLETSLERTHEAEEEPESSAPRPSLEGRVAALEREIDELKRQLESFRRQFE